MQIFLSLHYDKWGNYLRGYIVSGLLDIHVQKNNF